MAAGQHMAGEGAARLALPGPDVVHRDARVGVAGQGDDRAVERRPRPVDVAFQEAVVGADRRQDERQQVGGGQHLVGGAGQLPHVRDELTVGHLADRPPPGEGPPRRRGGLRGGDEQRHGRPPFGAHAPRGLEGEDRAHAVPEQDGGRTGAPHAERAEHGVDDLVGPLGERLAQPLPAPRYWTTSGSTTPAEGGRQRVMRTGGTSRCGKQTSRARASGAGWKQRIHSLTSEPPFVRRPGQRRFSVRRRLPRHDAKRRPPIATATAGHHA